jgi:3-phosphoglycerate kinase
MFTKQTVKDIDLKGKTVLLRADYNVPLVDGKITDDYRIKQSIPTVKYLLEQGVKLVICSHLGRPKGKVDKAYSLAPVAKRLSKLGGFEVDFADDCIGKEVNKAVIKLKPSEVLLLENLRFYPEEEANDEDFAKKLASNAEVFVQDGFGVVHRAHASTEAVTHFLPSVAGFLLENEVDTITNVMEKPKHPLMAVVGGAKISDKLEIIKRFVELSDVLAVGGALANPFLVAKGIDVGDSLYDKADVAVAKDIMKRAEKESEKRDFVLIIPHDSVVADSLDKSVATRIIDFSSNSFADIQYYPKPVPASAVRIKNNEKILDIGPFTASFIAGAAQLCSTVVWNGTMGVTEVESLQGPIGPFARGTQTVIEALVGDFGHKPFSLVGGGDTVGYLESRKIMDGFNHVSTGGGASLELMSGHKLPGVEALLDKNRLQ